jgi:hypothetical protein
MAQRLSKTLFALLIAPKSSHLLSNQGIFMEYRYFGRNNFAGMISIILDILSIINDRAVWRNNNMGWDYEFRIDLNTQTQSVVSQFAQLVTHMSDNIIFGDLVRLNVLNLSSV